MANFELFAEKVFRWEGGFVDEPTDRGGATNRGVTVATWRDVGYDKDDDGDIDAEDVRLLSVGECMEVLRCSYWNRWQADDIADQEIAAMVVDWLWCSGSWGIVIPQRILGVRPDGVVGSVTLSALNKSNPGKLLVALYNARLAFIRNIIRNNPLQKKFERGWLRRLNDFI